MTGKLPKHITIEEKSGELTIIRRWFSPVFIFTAFFVFFWNTMLIGYYAGIIYSILEKGEGLIITSSEAVSLSFPLVHLLLGIAFFYYTICGFINKTRICISFDKVSVTHGPLPWFGNKAIAVHDIKQLYCQQHRGNKGSLSYSVNVITRDFSKIKLLSGLSESAQAKYIEDTIEQHLNITDEAVEGEL